MHARSHAHPHTYTTRALARTRTLDQTRSQLPEQVNAKSIQDILYHKQNTYINRRSKYTHGNDIFILYFIHKKKY